MNSGAVAVIVLLNGLQIGMPAPAFVEGGRTWFPARAVLTEAGIPVTHQPDRNRVTIGEDARLMVDLSELRVQCASEDALSPTSARRIDGRLYLPASVLEPLGLEVGWNNTTKTLRITSAAPRPQPLSISEILDGPIRHLGSRLSASGEYRGRWGSVDRRGNRPFWRLQGPSEAIAYTHMAGSGLEAEPLKKGRRIRVTGRLRMSADGFVYVSAERIEMIRGPKALSVSLSTARSTYNRGDTLLIVVRADNFLDKPIEPAGTPRLTVTNPDNEDIYTVPADIQIPLSPGEHWRGEKTWQIPDNAEKGRYYVRLEHDILWAPQVYFEVGEDK